MISLVLVATHALVSASFVEIHQLLFLKHAKRLPYFRKDTIFVCEKGDGVMKWIAALTMLALEASEPGSIICIAKMYFKSD